ncbi:MAG: DUF499 domain-containing protein, partial [Spirochaetia bacterium]|nr:DUF499 domain-containing protein [Spirochaetia bacterium]
MKNSLFDVCTPRQSTFDQSRRDVVLQLSDLFDGKYSQAVAKQFFEENFVTNGMKILINKAFDRLLGVNDQAATFLLSQSMGGGKTHNMIALGLLARFPELRKAFWQEKDLGTTPIRVIGFDGRESDYKFGIWGALADQLGKKEVFNNLYSPLQPPGVSSWRNLLKGAPTIILLDELPPYFMQAKGKKIGDSNLADLTTTAISNLMVAANGNELSNVVIVISDLSGSAYQDTGMVKALDDLNQETKRSVLTLEPVAAQGEEIYHILRTRLFEKLPDLAVRNEVAVSYAEAVKKAKQMDLTAASPEAFASELRESYPFHFSLRDLYGRFKANPGFQQTRGLLRLMRAIVANLWETEKAKALSLIHPYDIDLNVEQIFSEFSSINPSLVEAVRKDLANNGHSNAELLDAKLGSGQAAQDAAKLIYIASLSTATSAVIGLKDTEVIGWLCAPGRDISRLRTDVLEQLPNLAWYLHLSNTGLLYFKNVQNLAAKLHAMVSAYNNENKMQELCTHLHELFKPTLGDVYQDIKTLPGLDDLDIQPAKVTLILTDPYLQATSTRPLHPEWQTWFESQEYRNRVLFLTGDRDTREEVLKNAAFYKAIQGIMAEQDTEGLSPRDPQREEAIRNRNKILLALRSAIQQTFQVLVYPSKGGLRSETINLSFENNKYDPEAQIRKTLEAVSKFSSEKASESWIRKIEDRLFDNQNPVPWSDIKKRAAVKPEWQWQHKDLLEDVRRLAIANGLWKDEGNLIHTGPFPKQVTSVRVSLKNRNPETGEAVLEIKPTGGTKVLYEIGDVVPSLASERVPDYGDFVTKDLVVSFLCIDENDPPAPTGSPLVWKNTVEVKGRDYTQGDTRFFELVSVPPGLPIRYSTNGSDPRQGGSSYDGPFPIPAGARLVLAVAEYKGIQSQTASFPVSSGADGGGPWKIDPSRPLVWKTHKRFANKPAIEAFQILNRIREAG